MNIFKLIGEVVVIYIVYKLIFSFIIPLYKSTKQMKGTVRNMQEKMKEQQRAQAAQQQASQKESPKTVDAEYIDYEEIK